MPAAAPHMDLVLRTSRLELRLPDDRQIGELARLARAGVEAEGQPPLISGWTMLPSPDRELGFVRRSWRVRAEVAPSRWVLSFAVIEDGELRGVQDLRAVDFPIIRQVDTGSWLSVRQHGRGIGTEMRAAVLEFAFAHLGAVTATTGWIPGSEASARVSEKLGYQHDGVEAVAVRGAPIWHPRARLGRAAWLASEARPRLVVEGLDAVLPLLLADAPAAPPDPRVWPGSGGPG